MRALAIVLALFSHGMGGVTGGWEALESHSAIYHAARLTTRSATPVLLMLLGASTEFAYVRYWRKSGRQARRRVLKRAGQCYLALAVVAASAAFGGAGVRQSLLGLVMTASPRGGEIFALYVCLFVLMLGIIPFRIRFGLVPTLIVALSWWPLAAALQPLSPGGTPLGYAVSRLLGIGAITGPSVLHSLALVVSGMIGGRVILDRHHHGWAPARVALVLATTAAGAVLALAVVDLGPAAVVRAYVDISAFRVHNHPAYFAAGMLICIGLVLAAGLALRFGVGGPHRTGPFSRASLLSFALGNIGINLVLPVIPTPTIAADAAASALLVIVLWWAMRAGRAWQEKRVHGPPTAVPPRAGWFRS